ncbi:ADP-heptose:LPS heptosyltransferase [Mucilaginibacter yixingensis]|uniref:ADP-heptose:LPS heptosyltransferase n=1 Tax=Mucilaginibacter yixingensis TaxID=1295612 RepID=A0A2T5JC56_9SPHI|nr:ADP-heptose:LPS heptosyltransferase [Mucilaginibacter yixingensis]
MDSVKRKRVLVYRIGSMGDTIIALPGFHKAVEAFPDAELILLANRPPSSKAAAAQTVLGEGYFFHQVINYPSFTRNPLVLLRLIRQLRVLKIDAMVNLTTTRIRKTIRSTKLGVLRDKLFFRAAGIKQFYGFPETTEDLVLTYDNETGKQEWEALRIARRLESLGPIDLTLDKYWDLHYTQQERVIAADVLKTLDPNRPVFAACAGTKRQPNDWEEYNWLALFKALKDDLPGWQLIMLGAEDERERAQKLLDCWNGDGVNLCGKTSPRVSGAALKHAKLFIGHDSGPMHLSAAGGTPCVAIYSARNLPGQWFPRGDFNKLIYHRVECAGCLLEECIAQQKKCILSITVDEVRKAIAEVIVEQKIDNLGFSAKTEI